MPQKRVLLGKVVTRGSPASSLEAKWWGAPFSAEMGVWRQLFVSEQQSKGGKYLSPGEWSGAGWIEALSVSFALLLQLLILPIPFLAGTALEVQIWTHSSCLEGTFYDCVRVFRKNQQLEAAGAVFQPCSVLASWLWDTGLPRFLDSPFQIACCTKCRWSFAIRSLP